MEAREGDKKSGVVVLDPYWQDAVVKQLDAVSGDVSRITGRNVSKALLKYFAGTLPDNYGRTWSVASAKILAPWNYKAKHWIGLVIDLVRWNIEVLDSDWYQIKDKELQNHLQPVAKLIPVVMQFSVELRARHTVNVPNPLTISRTVKIPRNETS